jgi:hypothetical protein
MEIRRRIVPQLRRIQQAMQGDFEFLAVDGSAILHVDEMA